MSDQAVARYVEELLAVEGLLARDTSEPAPAPAAETEVESEPEVEWRAAVNTLVVDGMHEHTARALMDSAKARGDDLIAWARHMVRVRENARRKYGVGS